MLIGSQEYSNVAAMHIPRPLHALTLGGVDRWYGAQLFKRNMHDALLNREIS